MKKFRMICPLLLLLLMLSACGTPGTMAEDTSVSSTAADQTPPAVLSDLPESEVSSASSASSAPSSAAIAEKQMPSAAASAPSEKSSADFPAMTADTQGTAPVSGDNTAGNSPDNSSHTNSTPTPSREVCTIRVECICALPYQDQLSVTLPSDGVWTDTTAEIESGVTTVYDVLLSSGVSVSGSSSYIRGINGLMEKDCPGLSGWMYSVNGTTPMMSCGSYHLSDGDSIVWYYTCD